MEKLFTFLVARVKTIIHTNSRFRIKSIWDPCYNDIYHKISGFLGLRLVKWCKLRMLPQLH